MPSLNRAHLLHAQHYARMLAQIHTRYLEGGANVADALAQFDPDWLNIQLGQTWSRTHAVRNEQAGALCREYAEAGTLILRLRQPPQMQILWWQSALLASKIVSDQEGEALLWGILRERGLNRASFTALWKRTSIRCHFIARLITRTGKQTR